MVSWDTGGTAIPNTLAFSISHETLFQPYPQKATVTEMTFSGIEHIALRHPLEVHCGHHMWARK